MRHAITQQIKARMALGAACAATVMLFAAPSVHAAIPSGTECMTVPYTWAGQTAIDPGQSFATGSMVVQEAGTQLEIIAVDVSTIDPAPGSVAVRVGPTVAADGVTVAGGEIAVTNDGSVAITLTRVELSVDQCHQVASAPVVVAPAGVTPAAPAAAVAPSASATPSLDVLPSTGRASQSVMALGAACTMAGAALLFVGRRRDQIA